MARQLRRATLFAPFVLLAGFLALSCFDNTAGPQVFQGRFSIVPQFATRAAAIVTLDRFRVLLRRTSDGSVALDTTIAITAGTDSVDLSLSVPMFTSSETFLLTLSLITPAGDTAFQAGPDTVKASTSGGAPPAVPVTVVYTGVGSHAKTVQILSLNPSVFFGDTVTLAAEALDSSGAAIPLTPIAWASLDTLRARVPNAGEGRVVGVAQRGPARITATLLNGPADTVAVLVQPQPARMAVEAGNNQSTQAGTALAQPVQFRVKGADSLGVATIVVRFSLVSGGTLSADSAISDDSGRVNVQWTLGPAAGPQSLQARIQAAIADSLVTATATALAGPPDSLAINDGDAQTAAASSAVAIAPSVVVRDSLNNLVPGVTVTFQVTSGGGGVTAATPTTDASGVARVGSWTLGTAAGANALRAFLVRGPGDTLSVNFSATATAAAAASLTVAGLANPITAGAAGSLSVTARDAFGNLATGYQGTVHFTSSDGGALLPADYTFVAGDSGVHAFPGGVKLATAGSQSVTATDAGSPSITGSQTVTVQPGAASPLTSVVTVSSSTVASGGTVTLALQAKDSLGNNLTTGGATVVFTQSGGTSTGTIGATTDSTNGVYTAVFTAVTAGTATSIGATLNGVAVSTPSPTITVTGGAAAALLFTTEPTDATVNGAIPSFQVTAKDAANNTATGFSGPVTLTFQNNPAGGSLTGTVMVNAVSGVATFSSVSITTVGSRYALQAGSTGLTPATSQQFLVTPVGMTHLWTGATSTDWTLGSNWQGGTAPSTVSDNVFVPASAATQPTISAPGLAVGAVVVETGATLSIASGDTLSVSGDLIAGSTSVAGPGAVRLAGSGKLAGSVPSLLLAGSYTASDSVKVSGDLVVRGPGDTLNLGGRRVTVSGSFGTDSSGVLVMASASDTLDVAGSISFAGGNDSLLTAGVLLARGDFTQVGYTSLVGCNVIGDSVETFKARGTHRVVLAGTATQTVAFDTPGPPLDQSGLISECATYAGGSQFANLEIDNAAGVVFASDILAAGSLKVVNGNIDATGWRVSVAGAATTAADLTASTLEVGDTLGFGAGAYAVVTSTFLGPVAKVPNALPYQTLNLVGSGTATWSGALNLTGSLAVGGTVRLQLGASSSIAGDVVVKGTGLLILGGHTLSLPTSFGYFQTSESGAFQMTAGLDSLIIAGFAYFQGGSTDGLLTAGTIVVGSNFYQWTPTDPMSFRSTGTKVVLNGTSAAQAVTFASPGDFVGAGTYAFGDSRFAALEVSNPFGFSLGSDVYATGDVSLTGGGAITDNAPGHTLLAANITAPSLSAAQVDVAGTLAVSGSYSVGNTIFSGTGQSVPVLPYQSLTVTGTATIGTAPTITGDLTVGPAAQLDIGGNSLTVPGNVDAGNTIVGTGTITMTGVGKTLNGTLPNLAVPTGADVFVDSAVAITGTGTQFIDGQLSLAQDGKRSVMTVAGTLEFSGPQVSIRDAQDTLYVGGDLNLYGTATDTTSLADGVIAVAGTVNEDGQFYALGTGNNTLLLNGTGSGRSIWFYATNGPSQVRHLEVTGTDTVTVGWPFYIAGNLTISGSGLLDLGGNAVTVRKDLATLNSGTLNMTSPSDSLWVGGNATFQGGGTGSRLTAGRLVIGGNFQQGGNLKSFAASPGHLTSFVGLAAQSITFANPDSSASHFGDLRVAQSTAPGVSLLSPADVLGAFRVPGDSLGAQKVVGAGNGLRVGNLNVSDLTLDHALLTWNGTGPFTGSFTRFWNTTFTNYLASDVQFYAYHPGLSGSAVVSMSNLTFMTVPTTGVGYYIKAEDSDGASPDYLNMSAFFIQATNLPGDSCATATAHFTALNGAQTLFSCS